MIAVRINTAHADKMLADPKLKDVSRRIMTRVTGDAAKLVRANFLALNKARNAHKSNFYSQEGFRKTTSEVSADGKRGAVVVGSFLMAHKFFGGAVRAKNAKYLAIPVSEWAKRTRANDLRRRQDIEFARSHTGAGLLFRVSGKGKSKKTELAYVLKRSVTHKPHPEVLPSALALSKTVSETCALEAEKI